MLSFANRKNYFNHSKMIDTQTDKYISKHPRQFKTMNNYFLKMQVFTFLTIIIFGTACNGPVQKDLPKEKEHPKLIKTIGDPRHGHVRCGLQDKAGNLWFGTTENGLYKYDGKSFRQFLVADGLISNSINDILEDKSGKIWIGTQDGVCLYDGKTFAKIQIPLPKNLTPNKNKFYQTQIVYDIMLDKAGKLWFATIDGVFVYDGKSLPAEQGSFTHFIINEAENGFLSSNDKAEHILEDKAGNIWFGGRTNEGVYRYDGKSITKFKLKDLFQNGPKPKAHNWAWPQMQDKNGNIWFSNWGGAYRYDGKSFKSFTKQDGLPGMVTRIIEDKNGNLWFGGDGICRYDARLPDGHVKSFTCFTTKDGLAHSGVWSVLEDKTGNIWVGTWETGLHLYDGKTFITYSEYKQKPPTD
jgi:ligand-binding sensor domain-containing protein